MARTTTTKTDKKAGKALTVPKLKLVAVRAARLLAAARLAATITTQEQADRAARFLRSVKTNLKEAEAGWRDALRPLNQRRDEDLRPWRDAEEILKPAVLAWEVKQREEARVRAKAALEEQERAAAAERARQAEVLKAAAENAPNATERKDLLAQARAVEKAPLTMLAVAVGGPAKTEGIGLVEGHEVEVEDLLALVKAVAAGTVPPQAVEADVSWLNKQANMCGGVLNYPGVRVKPKHTLRAARAEA